MNLVKLLAATDKSTGEVLPSGTDLDGTNDYLSRASDFTGNADGKAFTFSGWYYFGDIGGTSYIYNSTDGAGGLYIYQTATLLTVLGRNSGNVDVVRATIPKPIENTFMQLTVSIDLTNPSNRSIYLNDVAQSVTWVTYTNDDINFANSSHSAGATTSGTNITLGRLADLFLDYTYRDLSNAANRRLFTTIDPTKGLVSVGGAALGALSPIMTAFTNPEDLTENQGTGGAWTQNGVMARSNRGVNQFNAVASEFDGSADYLSLADVGTNSSKVMSGSVTFRADDVNDTVFDVNDRHVKILAVSTGVTIQAENSGGTIILNMQSLTPLAKGKHYSVQYSVNMANPAERHLIIDGVDSLDNVGTYTDDFIDFSGPAVVGRTGTGTGQFLGSIGELWAGVEYIDLSSSNPFWDSSTPKYLGELGELPTGSQPLVYLPIRAGDEGNNLGSAGDFTVNSGPFTGARGASEYWARSIVVDGSDYLNKAGGIFCQSLVKWLSTDSGVTWTPSYTNSTTVTNIGNGTDNGQVAYYFGTSESITWNETNKLRFTDALGFPIPPVIDENTVLFLDFTDGDKGLNQGTGGDYTTTGTPTQAGDVNA